MGLDQIIAAPQTEQLCAFPDSPPRPQKIPLSQLINKINRLNFREESVQFQWQHRQYGHTLSLAARPQPCVDEELECLWAETVDHEGQNLQAYELRHFIMTDGQRHIQVEPTLVAVDGRQVTVRLPAESLETHSRSIKRYFAPGIQVTLTANSAVYSGELLDFNAFSFRVRLRAVPPQTFDWISSSIPLHLTLADADRVIYAGDCSLLRQTDGRARREFVLRPVRSQFPRFRAREHRSERRELLPNLNVSFAHPVTGRTLSLKIVDISGTGFALLEPYEEATLLPGMILENVGIHLTSRTRLTCTAQVIHHQPLEGSGLVKVGLALLDIDPLEHMELVSLLQQAKDPDTYVSNLVDTDALWDFFFETGFIYPQKYASLAGNKDEFKATYNRLYTQQPRIARHFIHMEHNRILGHFAMLRLYRKTWCLHHHAALSNQRKSGLVVLERLSDFINDTHLLDSSHTHYTAGFYRSTNKFPVRFFGGMTEYLDDPKISSIDEFAYLNVTAVPAADDWDRQGRWELAAATPGDLEELRGCYAKLSGGLLLDALDLTPEDLNDEGLAEEFSASGFQREVHRLSIRKNGQLKAILAVNRTDVGLNFSELNNAIQLFVLDGQGFDHRDFNFMLSLVAVKFRIKRFPVLVFPVEFMAQKEIPFEKTYCCNILNSQHWDDYMRYLHRFLKKAKLRGHS